MTGRVEHTLLADGTLEVRTPDEGQPYFHENRAREEWEMDRALAVMRHQGYARPVLFRLKDPAPVAVRVWRTLEPVLKARGIPIFSAGLAGVSYVVPTDVARELLRPIFQKGAARLFRTPYWPRGYFTVGIGPDVLDVCESRTFKDAKATEGE
jgi:hypothetical protein